MSNFSNTNIILCAHGDKRGAVAERDSNLRYLKEAIKREFSPASCQMALLSNAGSLEEALSEVKDGDVLVIPLIFSDGYFYKKIEAAVSEAAGAIPGKVHILAPLCDWSELSDCIVRKVGRGPILMVAHGSARTSASKRANERLAKQVSLNTNHTVLCAYLEEEPFAEVVLAQSEAALNVVGLFLGSGLHGEVDWRSLLSKASYAPVASFTVGSMDELPRLVCAKVRSIYNGKASIS